MRGTTTRRWTSTCAPRRRARCARLTNARGYDAEASYSPDGQWIVFSSTRDAYDRDAHRRRAEAARARPELLRRDLHHARRRLGPAKRLTVGARLRRRPVLLARRHAHRLAALRRAGPHRRRLDDEARRHRRAADHRLRVDELGALHASVRASTSSSRRTSSASRTSSCSWWTPTGARNRCASPTRTASTACRCRRPTASSSPGRRAAAAAARPDLPRAVEPRAGARGACGGAPERKRHEACNDRCGRRSPQARRAAASAADRALAVGLAHGGTRPAASAATREHVGRSPRRRFEGREAGSTANGSRPTTSSRSSTRSARSRCRAAADMFVPFEFTAGTRTAASQRDASSGDRQARRRISAARRDVQALSFSDDGDGVGPGRLRRLRDRRAREPELRLRQLRRPRRQGQDRRRPALLSRGRRPGRRAILARYSDLRYKAMAARQRGARALLVVTGPRSPNAGETIPMTFDTALAGSGISAASISGDVARGDLRGGRVARRRCRRRSTRGNPHVAGFGHRTSASRSRPPSIREKQHRRATSSPTCRRRSPSPACDKPWVALGAHYDHLGRGDTRQLARAQARRGRPHVGADDNASGTAAVLADGGDARRAAARARTCCWPSGRPRRSASSARRRSSASRRCRLDEIAAYLNFDMVGRMQDNKLTVQATGTSPAWAPLLEQANVAAGFDLRCSRIRISRPTSPASTRPACRACRSSPARTPTITGRRDTADKINYEDLDRIAAFGRGHRRAA